jgi:hypothetical protein
MKNDKIIPGVVLILIGAAILLHNYGYLHFHWHNLIFLFPLMIVLWGINLIFSDRKSPWVIGLKLAIVAVGFGLMMFGNVGGRHSFWKNDAVYFDGDDSDDDDDKDSNGKITKIEGNSEFNAPYVATAKVARLNISGGGTTYRLSDTTSQLFTANTRSFKGRYVFNHSQKDSVYVLDFNMKGRHGINLDFGDDDDDKKDSSRTNSATFKLNTAPEWEIDVKTGATKLDFDLGKFKVRSLKLSGGAAAFDVKLGQPLATTNVTVSTGMSAVVISIPANAACRVVSSTGLSSTDFEGIHKKADGVYETPGYNTAPTKFNIKMSGGMADFKVKRY